MESAHHTDTKNGEEEKLGVLLGQLLDSLVVVKDPRKSRGKRYSLSEVLLIAILGCLCGCDSAEALEDWGKKESSWLSRFLPLEHGTPSQDVFLRVLSAINPESFRTAFIDWVRVAFKQTLGIKGQIAIDGQTHRGSKNRRNETNPLHMISALACDSGLVIGQSATDEKSNEITAIPALLKLLDLRGALVSIDAMGCQTKIASDIKNGGGDYLFGLKGNQSTLKSEVENIFQELRETKQRTMDDAPLPPLDCSTETDGGHGRIETRKASVVCLKGYEDWIPSAARFLGLISVIEIEATREDKISGKSSTEIRYYVSSANLSAVEAIKAVRSHWHVENRLHWCLDVTFGQDANQTRIRNAVENFAIIRHVALNLIRNFTQDRYSVPRRRRLCDYKPDFRELLLGMRLS